MKNIHIPKDIKFYVFRKIFIRVFFFLVLELGILWIIFTNSNHSIFEYGFDNRTLLNLLLAILPCFITGIPSKLIDKSWCGEIIETRIEQVRKIKTAGNFKSYPYNTFAIIADINMSNNRIVSKELKAQTIEGIEMVSQYKPRLDLIEQDLKHYNPNDIVCHIYGLKHFLIIRPQNAKIANCVICGTENSAKNNTCRKCKHSLIKIYRN